MFSPKLNGVVVPGATSVLPLGLARQAGNAARQQRFEPAQESAARHPSSPLDRMLRAALVLGGERLGLSPITACHSACVHAVSASQKPCVSVTGCCGPSSG
jgi:hypothetical protein